MAVKNGFATLLFVMLAATSIYGADTTTSAPSPPLAPAAPREAADVPHIRIDPKTGQPNAGWLKHHEKLVGLAKKGGIDLYFEGDSITDFWTTRGKAVWEKEFSGWHPGDFGVSGDRTEHVLW